MRSMVLLLLFIAQRGISTWNDSQSLESVKTRLVNYLFNDYNKLVEPSHADLKFGFRFLCSWKASPGSPLVSSVFEINRWTDRRLTWDPQNFGDVQKLRLPDELIWKPDMMLLNGLEVTVQRIPSNFILSHNGNISWYPKVIYKTFCSENPCRYNVALWTYDELVMPVTIWGSEPPDKYYQNTTCPLRIQSVEMTKHFYPCCKTRPKSYIQYNVTYTGF